MNLNEWSDQIKNSITTKKINENEYQIITSIFFSDNTPFEVFLMQDKNGNKILTDKRKTLKYMDEFYELDSDDVKNSISSIIDNYGIKLYREALVKKLKDSDDIATIYFEFISCISQLINMYVFFDEPKDDD